MTYDALNRVITTEDPFGLTLTYTYDADGNRIETQDSLGGVTTYVYDADNELISEQFGGAGQTPLRIDMTYDADGELLTETRYSDLAGTQVVVESSYTYDGDGEITSLVDINGGGTTVANFTYTYDLADRVTTEDNLGADHDLHLRRRQRADQRDLDRWPRSTTATTPTATAPAATTSIGPGNQLLSDGTWNYTYDADGNLIQKVGVSTGPDHGITWTYTYNNREPDDDGRRDAGEHDAGETSPTSTTSSATGSRRTPRAACCRPR